MNAIMYEAQTTPNPVIRIVPALAEEIGFYESVVLLQLEHWIHTARDYINGEPVKGIIRDGHYWTYQSTDDMKKKAFPFWSASTINRAIKSLSDKGYIAISDYNRVNYDKTRWFRLDYDGLKTLQSVTFVPTVDVATQDGEHSSLSGKRSSLSGKRSSLSGKRSSLSGGRSNPGGERSTQDGEPIPENTTETPSQNNTENTTNTPTPSTPDGDVLNNESDSGEYFPDRELPEQSNDTDSGTDTAPGQATVAALAAIGFSKSELSKYAHHPLDYAERLIAYAQGKADNVPAYVRVMLDNGNDVPVPEKATSKYDHLIAGLEVPDPDATPIIDPETTPDEDETEEDYLPPAATDAPDEVPVPVQRIGSMNSDALWHVVYDQLEAQFDANTFTWLRGAVYRGYEDGVFTIQVANNVAQAMCQERYYRDIRRVLCNLAGIECEIEFVAATVIQQADRFSFSTRKRQEV